MNDFEMGLLVGFVVTTILWTTLHTVIRVDVPLIVIDKSIEMCENNEGVDIVLASTNLLPKVKCNNGAVIPIKVTVNEN